MVRRAALILAIIGAFAAAACSGGKSGTVTLASPTSAQGSPAVTASATLGRTATPRTAPTPRPSPATAAIGTVAPAASGGWYTSSAGNAKYYYCDADRVDIAVKNRRAYPSEQALLAEWSGKRTKWPNSKC
jgi:hypothetical protein